MAENNLSKNKQGYGYMYTDLAQIHEYLEQNNMKYYQFIQRIGDDDYIMTKRCIDDKWEEEAIQGCRVVNATLSGKSNPAQEQGSALTYARRYSLLMAFGLATEDDDGESLSRKKDSENKIAPKISKERIQILESTQKKYKRTDEEVKRILKKYNCETFADLDESNWAKVGNELGGNN